MTHTCRFAVNIKKVPMHSAVFDLSNVEVFGNVIVVECPNYVVLEVGPSNFVNEKSS